MKVTVSAMWRRVSTARVWPLRLQKVCRNKPTLLKGIVRARSNGRRATVECCAIRPACPPHTGSCNKPSRTAHHTAPSRSTANICYFSESFHSFRYISPTWGLQAESQTHVCVEHASSIFRFLRKFCNYLRDYTTPKDSKVYPSKLI